MRATNLHSLEIFPPSLCTRRTVFKCEVEAQRRMHAAGYAGKPVVTDSFPSASRHSDYYNSYFFILRIRARDFTGKKTFLKFGLPCVTRTYLWELSSLLRCESCLLSIRSRVRVTSAFCSRQKLMGGPGNQRLPT